MPTTPTKTEVANKLKNKQTKIVLVRPKKSKSWLELDPTLDNSNVRNDDIKVCEVGLDQQECGENEICQPSGSKSRSGSCICKEGYTKDANNLCIIKGMHHHHQIFHQERDQNHHHTMAIDENG